MATSIAYWADSTYGYLEERRIVELAEELEFPLASFKCKHGAGLCTKGDKTGYIIEMPERSAAQVVIIEMGYNDDKNLSTGAFVKGMQEQSWFTVLKEQVSTVKHVIFIQQPDYHQVAQKKCRSRSARKSPSYEDGQLIEGSRWTTEAVQRVEDMLGIKAVVFDEPAEEIFLGFTRDDAGELWQDITKCRSKTFHGVDYSSDGMPALWIDACHPSPTGAEQHFRRLVEALKKKELW
jgi:hypothetical protein